MNLLSLGRKSRHVKAANVMSNFWLPLNNSSEVHSIVGAVKDIVPLRFLESDSSSGGCCH